MIVDASLGAVFFKHFLDMQDKGTTYITWNSKFKQAVLFSALLFRDLAMGTSVVAGQVISCPRTVKYVHACDPQCSRFPHIMIRNTNGRKKL